MGSSPRGREIEEEEEGHWVHRRLEEQWQKREEEEEENTGSNMHCRNSCWLVLVLVLLLVLLLLPLHFLLFHHYQDMYRRLRVVHLQESVPRALPSVPQREKEQKQQHQ